MFIEILKHYIFHVQFFYSVCLLWESANKGKPKVGFKLANERKQVYAVHCRYCMGT